MVCFCWVLEFGISLGGGFSYGRFRCCCFGCWIDCGFEFMGVSLSWKWVLVLFLVFWLNLGADCSELGLFGRVGVFDGFVEFLVSLVRFDLRIAAFVLFCLVWVCCLVFGLMLGVCYLMFWLVMVDLWGDLVVFVIWMFRYSWSLCLVVWSCLFVQVGICWIAILGLVTLCFLMNCGLLWSSGWRLVWCKMEFLLNLTFCVFLFRLQF